jgi:hypothetical protein
MLVVIDDVFLWLRSPYLAIPMTLLLIIIVVIFAVGGKAATTKFFNMVKGQATQLLVGATTKTAASVLQKES